MPGFGGGIAVLLAAAASPDAAVSLRVDGYDVVHAETCAKGGGRFRHRWN